MNSKSRRTVLTAKPRLFWKFTSSDHDQKQTAYQILVATSEKNLRLAHGGGALGAMDGAAQGATW